MLLEIIKTANVRQNTEYMFSKYENEMYNKEELLRFLRYLPDNVVDNDSILEHTMDCSSLDNYLHALDCIGDMLENKFYRHIVGAMNLVQNEDFSTLYNDHLVYVGYPKVALNLPFTVDTFSKFDLALLAVVPLREGGHSRPYSLEKELEKFNMNDPTPIFSPLEVTSITPALKEYINKDITKFSISDIWTIIRIFKQNTTNLELVELLEIIDRFYHETFMYRG